MGLQEERRVGGAFQELVKIYTCLTPEEVNAEREKFKTESSNPHGAVGRLEFNGWIARAAYEKHLKNKEK